MLKNTNLHVKTIRSNFLRNKSIEKALIKMDILMVVGGLLFLFLGGEALLKGSVSLARNFGLSKLLVSMVVVGFGTSMPEMTVSISAALKDSSDISMGNVVGSNIANILLIVGVGALMTPILIIGPAIRRDTMAMLGASILLYVFAMTGVITAPMGVIMLLCLIGYIAYAYKKDKESMPHATLTHIEEDVEGELKLSVGKAFIFTFLGLIGLVGGAYALVEGATSIARGFGISEAVIGLTIVAIGTSLPELATAIIASLRKHSDVIIGNILGSNIFNILAILSVTSFVKPVSVDPQILSFDILIMLGVSVLAGMFLLQGWRFTRVMGGLMLTGYIAYIAWLYVGGAII